VNLLFCTLQRPTLHSTQLSPNPLRFSKRLFSRSSGTYQKSLGVNWVIQ